MDNIVARPAMARQGVSRYKKFGRSAFYPLCDVVWHATIILINPPHRSRPAGGLAASMEDEMDRDQIFETLAAARDRVNNKSLPPDIRIRSEETVALCEERIRREGWSTPRKLRA